jgi:hypothetical protein
MARAVDGLYESCAGTGLTMQSTERQTRKRCEGINCSTTISMDNCFPLAITRQVPGQIQENTIAVHDDSGGVQPAFGSAPVLGRQTLQPIVCR